MKPKFSLTLNRCPHGVEMLSLDDSNGGVNLTGQKCCGRWNVVKTWPMTASNLERAAAELKQAAEMENL